MSTPVHDVLGVDTIKRICLQVGLSSEEQIIVDKILESWTMANILGEDLKKKVAVALEIIGDNRRSMHIVIALLSISSAYLFKKTEDLESSVNAS